MRNRLSISGLTKDRSNLEKKLEHEWLEYIYIYIYIYVYIYIYIHNDRSKRTKTKARDRHIVVAILNIIAKRGL